MTVNPKGEANYARAQQRIQESKAQDCRCPTGRDGHAQEAAALAAAATWWDGVAQQQGSR